MTRPQPSRRRVLREVWQDAPSWLRTGTKGSFAIAGFMFGIGVAGDGFNWGFSEWGYFMNLYSSATAFFVGVPVALLGLDAVNERRSTIANIEKTENLTQNAWASFGDAVRRMTDDDIMSGLGNCVTDIYNVYFSIRDKVVNYVNSQPLEFRHGQHRPTPGHDPTGYQELLQEMDRAASDLREVLNEMVYSFPMDRDTSLRWAHLRSRWRFIDSDVQTRRFELGLPWLGSSAVSIFEDLLANESHPLGRVFWQIKGPPTEHPYHVFTVKDLPNTLDWLSALDEDQFLFNVKTDTSSPFGSDVKVPDAFLTESVNARTRLRELRTTYEAVDSGNYQLQLP